MGRRRHPAVISLFSGAGGLDYGFEAAGFRTSVAVEMDPTCCRTLRANRAHAVIERDIHEVPSGEILEAAKLKRGEADILIGGPPCQPFSKAGYWARGDSKRLDDPRASTLRAYLRVMEDTLPAAILLENVEGLGYSGKSEGAEVLLQEIREINRRCGTRYEPVFKVLCAADFGVPQLRSRFFLIASREGLPFAFPEPTHGAGEDDFGQQRLLSSRAPYRTAWDALGDEEPQEIEALRMSGKWAELMPSIPEGENYLWHTDRGGGLPLFGWRRRFWSFLLKLAKSKPSWTLQAQPGPATGPFHWTSRRLSARELCRLQTFPDSVSIVGNLGAVQRQLGNAVPSLLAEVLGREIRAQVLGGRRAKAPPTLLPPDRGTPPPPEHVAKVPGRYLHLVGDHAAHPGTGKGYRATRWAEQREQSPLPAAR